MSKPKNVIFATPSYMHTVSLEYLRSVIETLNVLTQNRISAGFSVIGGDQFIAKARNLLVAMFLAHEDATDLFFLDDDVGWPATAVLKFINRPEDVILGVYPKKQAERDFPVELAGDRETGSLIERDGLVKVSGGPTGFMRIRRHVLEHLAHNAGTFVDNDSAKVERVTPNIFRTGVGEDRRFYGEDWAFCQDVQAAGFEVWCDPDIVFTHRGNNLWTDNLATALGVYREKGRKAAQELKDAEQQPTLPASDGTPGTEAVTAEG